jgi:hypothetical protein
MVLNRARFALFLKVLIRCLERSNQTSVLRQTRLVVLACIRGHKMGDPSFYPLDRSIEMRLKKLVDYNTWEKAKSYTKYYIRMKQQQAVARRYNQLVNNGLDFEPTRIEQI